MKHIHCCVIGWLAGSAVSVAVAADAWTPEIFDYDRPDRLEVTEKGSPRDVLPETRQLEWTFRNLRQQEVPVLVTLPPKGKGPFPPVLLVHALGGDRRHITLDLGKALTAKGFACVAIDLPSHGNRGGKPEELFEAGHAEKAYRNIVGAVQDLRQAIDLIKQRKEFDSERGVPLVGYSMGAWFGSLVAAADRRISTLVLWGGGTGTGVPQSKSTTGGKLFGSSQDLLREHPTLRIETAIPHFAPRPLLMQNGKKDPFISEESVKNLYRAAEAPKELKWYDAGHVLPEKAAVEAAEWILKQRR